MRSTNIFRLIAAAIGATMPNFIPSPGVRAAQPTKRGKRWPSNTEVRRDASIEAGTPGAKLARKAARGQLTKIHPGLSPKVAGRYPFSAARAGR